MREILQMELVSGNNHLSFVILLHDILDVLIFKQALTYKHIMAVAEKAKRSEQRKRKPKILAVINDACTGCGGSPICVTECPVDNCMLEVQNPDAPQFIRIEVDPLLCIGCKKCITKGPMDTLLEGCPWDAIDMIDLAEFEEEYGTLPY